jgi:hypothetical protein
MDNGRQTDMPRRRYTPEESISKLREAEVLLSQNQSVGKAAPALANGEQTHHRWRSEHRGYRTELAQRLKAPEQENIRLKWLVADLSLDNALLRETVSGNPGPPPGLADQPGKTTASGGALARGLCRVRTPCLPGPQSAPL